MTWKQEGKEVLQNLYGGYCKMVEELNLEKLTYCMFTLEEYDKIKQLYNDKRRSITRNFKV